MWPFSEHNGQKVVARNDSDFQIYDVYPCQTGVGCIYTSGHCAVLFRDGRLTGPPWLGLNWCPHSGWTDEQMSSLDMETITRVWDEVL